MDATTATEPCGCTGFSIDRRRFLASAAALTGAVAGAQMFGDSFRQVAYGAETGNNVLVVLSMRGGADGLSMVVPRGADWDTLSAARPGIVVPKASLVGGDTNFGLHPAFAPLVPMWNAGTFGAVHAVGLPAPNRSHFDAMEAIEDASVNDSLRVGWINRTVGVTSGAVPETAMQLGTVLLPTSLTGPAPALGASQLADLALVPLDSNANQAPRQASINAMWAGHTDEAGNSVRDALGTVNRLAPLVTRAAVKDTTILNPANYPTGALQSVLSNTAALIKADVGAKFITVDYGNWDMHQGLGTVSSGWMLTQVTHLAASLKAFFDDLGTAATRVTVVTMSEFGRRVAQNGSAGLDHGYGNVMLTLGAGVAGGTVKGEWPGLSTLNQGDLAVRTNFQSVLWEVIANRFPALSGQKATIFPDLAVPQTIGTMS
ncbi:DUF1501 domain-containing protein [Nocardioides mangrovicus]|nr:DUF1501 domain-containing protein [Nocardioides mangrovicus]